VPVQPLELLHGPTNQVVVEASESRSHGRFLAAGLATTAGFIAWNLTLNATHAAGFNTECPGGWG